MKHIGIVVAGVAVFAVLALIVVSISGPLVGKVFSTINTDLSYSEAPGIGGALPNGEEFRSARTVSLPAMDGVQNQDSNSNAAAQNRLVIKNADLTIVIEDPTAKMQAISVMAASMGGFVVSSSIGETYLPNGTKAPEGSIVVRIPAPKLDDALNEIKRDAVDVQNESTSGQDVTKEYTDLQSQLKNLEATEKKLTEIMDQAEKTEDVLAVFNQLTQIRGQIEIIKGQMQYYEQSAALSAVSVRLLAEETIQPIEIAGWEPQGQARDAAQALVDFFQGFVNFLIWLVIFLIPVAAVLIILLALLWRLLRWFWRKFFPNKPAA